MSQRKRHLTTMFVPKKPQNKNETPKPIYALFLHYFSVPRTFLP